MIRAGREYRAPYACISAPTCCEFPHSARTGRLSPMPRAGQSSVASCAPFVNIVLISSTSLATTRAGKARRAPDQLASVAAGFFGAARESHCHLPTHAVRLGRADDTVLA